METKSYFLAVSFIALAGLSQQADAGRCAPQRHCNPARLAAAPENPSFPEMAEASSSVAAAGEAVKGLPLIAPIYSLPGGQTYGRWAAEWQQWAASNTAERHPLTDPTGQHCAERQVGQVWFLGGVYFSSTATRSCTVPVGKALFFPLINTFYSAFLNDLPVTTRTEEFVRERGSCTEAAVISVWIDGARVPRPTRFFTGPGGSQSPIYNAQMPPNNVGGYSPDPNSGPAYAQELALVPSAEQGYYLFVYPLTAGTHTIRWIATGCTQDALQDITYNLSVAAQ
jgi:hypothetical protein